MKDSRDREEIKSRIADWMGVSGVNKLRDSFDMTILETFFYVYNGINEGLSIQEIGNDLGVFPLP